MNTIPTLTAELNVKVLYLGLCTRYRTGTGTGFGTGTGTGPLVAQPKSRYFWY